MAEIAPLLQRHCIACHGPEKAKGRFRLDTFQSLLQPGASDKSPVVPGRPNDSLIYQLMTAVDTEERMPQNAPSLTPGDLAIVRDWIAQGAKFDGLSPFVSLVSVLNRPEPSLPPQRYVLPWPVTALAFSPDGAQLSVGGYGEITFWDPTSGALLQRRGGMPQRIRAITWRPGSDLLAVAGGVPGRFGTLVLTDATGQGPVVELATARDEVLCAAFSPDGERLALGVLDGTLRVFDVNSKREALTLAQHSDAVNAVAFSPDGRWFTSASRDRTARIYDCVSGSLAAILRDHDGPIDSVVFNEVGTRILTAGADRFLRIWDTTEGERSKVFAQFDSAITGVVPGESSVFIALAEGRVLQRRLPDGDRLCEFMVSNDRVTALAFHPGLKWLAAGSHDGRVHLWNLQDAELVMEFIASPGIRQVARR